MIALAKYIRIDPGVDLGQVIITAVALHVL
jgi:hypothetical protein